MKTKISEYSTTNSDNTDIESININEGCAPSGINNAIRELMVHLKEWQSGAADTYNTPAGTVSAPAIAPTGDTNTGIFFPAADTIAFAEGGAEAMRISDAGNVGIGTTSPATKLDVQSASTLDTEVEYARFKGGTTTQPCLRIGGNNTTDSATRYTFINSDSLTGVTGQALAFQTDSIERMRIDSSGNVLVGATSASYGSGSGVIIQRSGTATLRLSDATNSKVAELRADSTGVILSARGAYPIRFDQDDTERMRITSAGEVLVGGTTSLNASSGAMSLQAAGGGSFNLFRNDTSVVSGDFFGAINFWGNDTTSNTPTAHAYIGATASGTHAAGDNPTDIVFGCTNDGSETVAEFARLGIGGGTATSSRVFRIDQPTLTDGAYSYFEASAGTAGTSNRSVYLGCYKHSGITNACGFLFLDEEDGGNSYFWTDNSGNFRISSTVTHIGTTSGTVVGTQTSDERIKNILGPVEYGLAEVLSIEPVKFALKDDPDQTPKLGFIAQQVNPIVPESVFDTDEVIEEGEPTKLGMEYVSLIPVLVNAIKELSAENDALEARIAALESA